MRERESTDLAQKVVENLLYQSHHEKTRNLAHASLHCILPPQPLRWRRLTPAFSAGELSAWLHDTQASFKETIAIVK
jgi:hypothetical protein